MNGLRLDVARDAHGREQAEGDHHEYVHHELDDGDRAADFVFGLHLEEPLRREQRHEQEGDEDPQDSSPDGFNEAEPGDRPDPPRAEFEQFDEEMQQQPDERESTADGEGTKRTEKDR